jgi:hypothetical protein
MMVYYKYILIGHFLLFEARILHIPIFGFCVT